MTRIPAAFTTLAAVMALSSAGITASQAAVKTGTLVCNVEAGIGMIVLSKKALACTFKSTSGRREDYLGYISKLGVDIGATSAGTIVWAVFEPSDHPWALSGNYAGATAEATVVVGLGANVLVGGFDGAVALQPLSVTGQAGLGIAAGIGALTLQRVR
jgi:hypothetical protein